KSARLSGPPDTASPKMSSPFSKSGTSAAREPRKRSVSATPVIGYRSLAIGRFLVAGNVCAQPARGYVLIDILQFGQGLASLGLFIVLDQSCAQIIVAVRPAFAAVQFLVIFIEPKRGHRRSSVTQTGAAQKDFRKAAAAK